MRPLVDLTGKRFTRLVVLGRGDNFGDKPGWNCVCDCGKTQTVRGSDLKLGKHKVEKAIAGKELRNGHTTSCGCNRGNPGVPKPRKRK